MADQTIYPYGTDGELPSSIGIINDLNTGGVDKALSAQMGKELADVIMPPVIDYEDVDFSDYTLKNIAISSDKKWVNSGSNSSYFIPVVAGDRYVITRNDEHTANFAYLTSNTYTNLATVSTWVSGYNNIIVLSDTAPLEITIPEGCNYLYVRNSDSDGDNYLPSLSKIVPSQTERHNLVEEHGERIDALEEEVDEISNNTNKSLSVLDIGELEQGTWAGACIGQKSTTTTTLTTRIIKSSLTALPYKGVTINYNIKDGYNLSIVGINSATSSSSDSMYHGYYWLTGKGSVSISNDCIYYRIVFSKGASQDQAITTEEVEALMQSGEIELTYEKKHDIIEDNDECDKYAKAIALKFVSGTIQTGNLLGKFPLFAHISDLHGDEPRYLNCLKYSKMFGCDAVILSGDTIAYEFGNKTTYVKTGQQKYPNVVVSCIGNHEVYQVSNLSQAFSLSEQVVFDEYISALVQDNGYMEDSTTTAEHTYFYRDFATKSIRVIALDQYCGGIYGGHDRAGRLGQAQITWLCNTLASTPSGYGVIIVMHSHEDVMLASENTNEQVFNQTVRGKDYNTNGLYVGYKNGSAYRPISKIVDAFISKTTLNDTYTEKDSSGTSDAETVTIAADFTNVAASTEFIAYFCGHQHEDFIGYYQHASNMQLCITVSAGIAYYGTEYTGMANYEDLPRGTETSTQDLFNIYAIDRTNGMVRVARIGSNVNFQLKERKAMTIPYKE